MGCLWHPLEDGLCSVMRGTESNSTGNAGAGGNLSPEVSTGRLVPWMSEFPRMLQTVGCREKR